MSVLYAQIWILDSKREDNMEEESLVDKCGTSTARSMTRDEEDLEERFRLKELGKKSSTERVDKAFLGEKLNNRRSGTERRDIYVKFMYITKIQKS